MNGVFFAHMKTSCHPKYVFQGYSFWSSHKIEKKLLWWNFEKVLASRTVEELTSLFIRFIALFQPLKSHWVCLSIPPLPLCLKYWQWNSKNPRKITNKTSLIWTYTFTRWWTTRKWEEARASPSAYDHAHSEHFAFLFSRPISRPL